MFGKIDKLINVGTTAAAASFLINISFCAKVGQERSTYRETKGNIITHKSGQGGGG